MNNHISIDYFHTAMLIIDMQKAFVEPGQPLCVSGALATVPAISKTVETIRDRGGLIIWVRREYEPDGSDMESFRREQMKINGTLSVMARGSYGVSPVTGLEGIPEDFVIIKKRFSGFFHTGLQTCLDENHIRTLLIAGTQTPNCVRATAFDAVSCDYRTIVISDCTSSSDSTIQENNLRDMENAGIEIISSAELMYQ